MKNNKSKGTPEKVWNEKRERRETRGREGMKGWRDAVIYKGIVWRQKLTGSLSGVQQRRPTEASNRGVQQRCPTEGSNRGVTQRRHTPGARPDTAKPPGSMDGFISQFCLLLSVSLPPPSLSLSLLDFACLIICFSYFCQPSVSFLSSFSFESVSLTASVSAWLPFCIQHHQRQMWRQT